ncbi:hypothetical protein HZF05_04300 [Sphingomonas sp. CGMCC 1.13654]|uniref:Uncharacterized protein n=1 Tax=Sphingomonas chungangi TaxID=2683589 RepID=A0A838L300_9SPHN|nr:hypothetical protein [Sphingomonas chungangi]MBA2933310.1 hypothetical protein [Sphingomonas chungangi]MVW54644.1 hypothetical protein [Sphingomonas chungangi]
MTLQAFTEYRDRMLSIMDEAETKLGHAVPADSLMLDLARNRMARILTAYHLFADRELFGPCAAPDPASSARLKIVAAECAALAQDFRAFSRDCTINPVIERWAGYRLDALAMMARIRKHLAAAEVEARYCAGAQQPPPTSYRSAA